MTAMSRAGIAKLDELRLKNLDADLPWGGRSPRVLTWAYKRFILRREAAPLDEEDARIDEQYRRFTHGS